MNRTVSIQELPTAGKRATPSAGEEAYNAACLACAQANLDEVAAHAAWGQARRVRKAASARHPDARITLLPEYWAEQAACTAWVVAFNRLHAAAEWQYTSLQLWLQER